MVVEQTLTVNLTWKAIILKLLNWIKKSFYPALQSNLNWQKKKLPDIGSPHSVIIYIIFIKSPMSNSNPLKYDLK